LFRIYYLSLLGHFEVSSFIEGNEIGFMQVWDFEFRLLVNVSQNYLFELKFYSFAQ
jgi:hypothetical protein